MYPPWIHIRPRVYRRDIEEETFVVSVIAQIIKGQRESSFSDKGS